MATAVESSTFAENNAVRLILAGSCELGELTQRLEPQQWRPEEISSMDFVNRYFETESLDLHRSGWEYFLREEQGGRTACLNPRSESHIIHSDPDVGDSPSADRSVGNLDVETEPVPLPLEKVAESGKLHESFRVQIRRNLYQIPIPESGPIEMKVDRATITAGTAANGKISKAFHFTEITLAVNDGATGATGAFERIVGFLENELHFVPSKLTVYERGLHLTGLRTGLTESIGRNLLPEDSSVQLVHRYLTSQFAVLRNCEPIAWEGIDPNGVHQMRVGTRRIRAALRCFRDAFPARSVQFFVRELKWLADSLREIRELDVHLGDIAQYAESISTDDVDALHQYRVHLFQERMKARRRMLRCLDSCRYSRLLQRFQRFLTVQFKQRRRQTDARVTIRESARASMSRRVKHCLRLGDQLKPDSPARLLHDLRIQGKRLRYVLEMFQDPYERELRKSVRTAKRLQDSLGGYQDAEVASNRLLTFANRMPMRSDRRRLLLVLGQLIYRQRQQAEVHRARFHRQWKRLKKGIRNKKLRSFLAGSSGGKTETSLTQSSTGSSRKSRPPVPSKDFDTKPPEALAVPE